MATPKRFLLPQDYRNGFWLALDRLMGTVFNPAAGRTVTANTTLVLADVGTTIRSNAAGATTFSITNDATGGWVGDAIISVLQLGAGAPAFSAGSGVTLRAPAGLPASVQYGVITVMRIGTDQWTQI